MRHITNKRVVGTGLVGKCIGNYIPLYQTIKQINGIAQHTNAFGFTFAAVMHSSVYGIINAGMFFIQVFCFNAFINAPFFYFSNQCHTFVHGNGQRLCATHTTEAGCYIQSSFECAAKMFVGNSCIGFISALHNALAADIYPRTSRHLAIHHQAFLFQFIKMFPVGPIGNQLRIADKYPWCILMCF